MSGSAELRNSYGTGHGKPLGRSGLGPRYARLAVGTASRLATVHLRDVRATVGLTGG
ncbi:MAG: abortive infection family protein [Acidimicrobiales bacterium]